MATYGSAKAITGVAAIDLSTFLYHFGVFTTTAGEFTSGTTTLSAQGRVDGIVGEAVATAGLPVQVVVADGGKAKVKLGATVTAGALVATAADGRAIAQGAGNGALAWGIFLEAGDANEIVSIQFIHKGQVNA